MSALYTLRPSSRRRLHDKAEHFVDGCNLPPARIHGGLLIPRHAVELFVFLTTLGGTTAIVPPPLLLVQCCTSDTLARVF